MSTRQLTFKERIRLLDIAAHEIEAHAERLGANQRLQKRLRDVADLIADEAARMKLSNQRWEAQRRQAKTASLETVKA